MARVAVTIMPFNHSIPDIKFPKSLSVTVNFKFHFYFFNLITYLIAHISMSASGSLCLSSVPLTQSKADSQVSDYKQLTALSRVRAIYDTQPDLIPYQADHAHARVLEDTLERYSCGQVHRGAIKTIKTCRRLTESL